MSYALGEPKYSVEECIERDMTYSAPLKATLQLVVIEEVDGPEAAQEHHREGGLPRRAADPDAARHLRHQRRRARDRVSQLHRSPGVVFEESTHPNGQRLFSARIIPFRGSWVEFTIDIHDVIYVHIDKKKKFPATALLRAFGYGTNADILRLFFATKELDITGKLEGRQEQREVIGALLAADVPEPGGHEGRAARRGGRRADPRAAQRAAARRRQARSRCSPATPRSTCATRSSRPRTRERHDRTSWPFDVADPETGEVLAEAGEELTDTLQKKLLKAGRPQGGRAAARRARASRR